jgi:hypothetical protein
MTVRAQVVILMTHYRHATSNVLHDAQANSNQFMFISLLFFVYNLYVFSLDFIMIPQFNWLPINHTHFTVHSSYILHTC